MPEGGLSDLEARFLQLCLHSEIAVGRFDRELTPYRSLEKKGLVNHRPELKDETGTVIRNPSVEISQAGRLILRLVRLAERVPDQLVEATP